MSSHQPAVLSSANASAIDASETLDARFKAWRALVKNLEDYFKHLEKVHESSAKDHHKLAKVLDVPFKQSEHFDKTGIETVFTSLQTTTQRWSSDQEAYAKSVHNTLVAQASSLQDEIQSFEKRLKKDGIKSGKGISKIHADTQKHIELLGKHTSSYETNPKGLKADADPYLLKRGILNKLSHQVAEENAHNQTVLAFQKQCEDFEVKIVRAIQQMVSELSRLHASQGQDFQSASTGMVSASNQLAPDHEWKAFVARDHSLLNANMAKRELNNITFAGSDHASTAPVVEGDLWRKGTVIKKYNPAYFVLTKAGFLHEFKSKNIENDPEPSWTLDIKDATIGAHSTQAGGKNKFIVSGKSKGLLSSKHDFAFQASNFDEMMAWWTALCKYAANAPTVDTADLADDSDTEVVSPAHATNQAAVAPTAAAVPAHTTAAPAAVPVAQSGMPAGHAQPVGQAAPASYAQPVEQAASAGYAQPAATYAEVPTQQLAQTHLDSGAVPTSGVNPNAPGHL